MKGIARTLTRRTGALSTFPWLRPWRRICLTGQTRMSTISWYRNFFQDSEWCASLAALHNCIV